MRGLLNSHLPLDVPLRPLGAGAQYSLFLIFLNVHYSTSLNYATAFFLSHNLYLLVVLALHGC